MTVNEDEILHRYGLRPVAGHLDQFRDLLMAQTELERQGQGYGNTEVLKISCAMPA
ncbi:hypothetical protein [Salinispora arenicola]|uniref:hypothetical protein n=1 Tax=Salinispora arenicola TaxID=168697 RepID=UPI0012BBC2B9|nr:hypothetical protein [Salinispora arenicola]MCN0180977.1 hypothetical protein [Salinispora arenicola]